MLPPHNVHCTGQFPVNPHRQYPYELGGHINSACALKYSRVNIADGRASSATAAAAYASTAATIHRLSLPNCTALARPCRPPDNFGDIRRA
jgi:hypothetical protein